MRRISSEPHLFSANVLLRPVVQDYLLPTACYLGGAAEIGIAVLAVVELQDVLSTETVRIAGRLVERSREAVEAPAE